MNKSPELWASLITEPNFLIIADFLVTGVWYQALLLGIATAAFSKPCSWFGFGFFSVSLLIPFIISLLGFSRLSKLTATGLISIFKYLNHLSYPGFSSYYKNSDQKERMLEAKEKIKCKGYFTFIEAA